VTVRTTGRELVDVVYLSICSNNYYSTFACRRQSAASNGTVTFAGLDAGEYVVGLEPYLLPENCAISGDPYRVVSVQGATVPVDFTIECRAFGTVRVTTVTSGTNQDASYLVLRPSGCDNYYVACDAKTVPASGSVDFRAAAGRQTFELADVSPNCAPTTANPAAVTAIEDGIVEVRFEVICR
jgi:hypothetical protein